MYIHLTVNFTDEKASKSIGERNKLGFCVLGGLHPNSEMENVFKDVFTDQLQNKIIANHTVELLSIKLTVVLKRNLKHLLAVLCSHFGECFSSEVSGCLLGYNRYQPIKMWENHLFSYGST